MLKQHTVLRRSRALRGLLWAGTLCLAGALCASAAVHPSKKTKAHSTSHSAHSARPKLLSLGLPDQKMVIKTPVSRSMPNAWSGGNPHQLDAMNTMRAPADVQAPHHGASNRSSSKSGVSGKHPTNP